jgi:hypothetical protein
VPSCLHAVNTTKPCELAHRFCSKSPGGVVACLSMAIVNHPVGEHTRGQEPNANLTPAPIPCHGQTTHGPRPMTYMTSANMVP